MSSFDFESGTFYWFYPITFVLCGELCLLVSWCAGDRCDMMGSDADHGRNRRPSAEDRGWSNTGRILSGWTIEKSGDAVCGLHRAQGDEERRFLGLASKPWSTVCQWFGLKITRSGFSVWVSKPVAIV
jgi:hypothetical protein